jgi:hypothetical protein
MFRPVTIAEAAVRPHPDFCPNCDTRSERKKLFCSELCNQEAQLIRYIRRVLKDDRAADVEVLRDGIGTRMLMVRSGGYPTRARTIAPALRAAVVARDAAQCVLCGAPGTEIDHIRGSSDELTNLRLTCKTCNGDRVRDAAVIATDPETIAPIQRQNSRISQRIAAAAPYRLCDDEERWSTAWRTYKKNSRRHRRLFQRFAKCPAARPRLQCMVNMRIGATPVFARCATNIPTSCARVRLGIASEIITARSTPKRRRSRPVTRMQWIRMTMVILMMTKSCLTKPLWVRGRVLVLRAELSLAIGDVGAMFVSPIDQNEA